MPVFVSKSSPGRPPSMKPIMNTKWVKKLRAQSTNQEDITRMSSVPLPPLPHIEELPTPEHSNQASPIISIKTKKITRPDNGHPHDYLDKSVPHLRGLSSSSTETLTSMPSRSKSPGKSGYSANPTMPLRIEEGASADMPARAIESDATSSTYAEIERRTPTSRKLAPIPKEYITPRLSSDRSPSPLLPLRIEDGVDMEHIHPVTNDDPLSYNLVERESGQPQTFDLEKRSQTLFSSQHLWQILSDTDLNRQFATFIRTNRPWRLPIFNYYMQTVKAIRAIEYSNALTSQITPLPSHPFTTPPIPALRSLTLEKAAQSSFENLLEHDLPQYISTTWLTSVSQSILHRITTPHPSPSDSSLAEVFCLTDPSRPDNPIILSSHEFSLTTQYGAAYVLGRNCRFLQGPGTSKEAVGRLREAVKEGKSCLELLLNYRRDGTPFLNLLSLAPLVDDGGRVVYFLGAQVDVSGLARGMVGLEGVRRVVEGWEPVEKGEFRQLSEMFDEGEVECARRFGGEERGVSEDVNTGSGSVRKTRVVVRDDPGPPAPTKSEKSSSIEEDIGEGKLHGVFQDWVLIRPAPSLRILFTSPSLRGPGIQQSYFPDRIGGATNVRNAVMDALKAGRDITAKVLWKVNEYEGQARWIHCTPLYADAAKEVGAWMVILVDDTRKAQRDVVLNDEET